MRKPRLVTSLLILVLFWAALPGRAEDKKDDVDDIGDRKVAHRSIISQEKEIAIGKQYADQIDEEAKMLKDPVINEYVNRVAQNLARNSDLNIPLTVKVIDDPAINAFTLPGGFMYVNTGFLMAADEEDQVAGVIAHEIGHAAARHWASQMTKQTIVQFAMIPLMFIPMSSGLYGRHGSLYEWRAAGLSEIQPEGRAGGGLPGPPIHVQGGVRPQRLRRLLRQGYG